MLKPEFLETLPSGSHEIGIVSSKGTVTAPIKVTGTSAKPNKPGDSSNPGDTDDSNQNQNPGSNSDSDYNRCV